MYPKRGPVENHVTRWTSWGAAGALIATAVLRSPGNQC